MFLTFHQRCFNVVLTLCTGCESIFWCLLLLMNLIWCNDVYAYHSNMISIYWWWFDKYNFVSEIHLFYFYLFFFCSVSTTHGWTGFKWRCSDGDVPEYVITSFSLVNIFTGLSNHSLVKNLPQAIFHFFCQSYPFSLLNLPNIL